MYYHVDAICEQFVATGKCSESRFRINRHPKVCKFWLGDPRGCLRGQMCMYLHKVVIVDLEEEMSPENDIILDLRTKHDTLERDNKLLKEELEKLKRVLINMNNVLKTKYS